MSGPYDPRAIANLLLDEADRRGWKITNLALQKLLYFAHGLYLTKMKSPLVSGYFEAWQYGPVHPSVYRAFKPSGSEPINSRAVAQDPLTGKARDLPKPTDLDVIDLVSDVMRSYGHLPPGRLVDLSHAKGSPWEVVVDKARTNVAFGMRISDDIIIERFRHHKVSVGSDPRAGEPPSDDTPFA
ncbi:type VI toxin-antitoxin system SocA family antitoxin [Pannonibacter phragmitetus]|uniref:type VI toxin-antitoxin system SocA family antitoxin n=1 Tax=Pannonibacter phragmitetus TaxID=121719 RepID=UPI003D2F005C